MAGIGNIGGLGTMAQGLMQGYQQGVALQQSQDNSEFLQTQRKRMLDEQQRADELRNADRAVSTTKQVGVDEMVPVGETPADGVGPVPMEKQTRTETRKRSQDEVYRDLAENRRKAGDIAGYFDYEDKANKTVFARNINLFGQVVADSANKPAIEVAKEIGQIFDSDPMNGGTKSIEALPDGGVRMTLVNKDTGKTSTKEFTGPQATQQMLQSFQPYFQPEMYAKLQQETALARARIAEEIAKNPYQTVAPGASAIDKRTGKVVYNNLTDRVITGSDADGNPIYGRPAGGTRGTGASAGGGKLPKENIDAATDILEKMLPKASDEAGVARNTRALGYLDRIYRNNPSLSSRQAAEIAAEINADPTKVRVEINKATGKLSTLYSHPAFDDGRPFDLGIATNADEMEKSVGRSGMVNATTDLVNSIVGGLPEEQQATERQRLITVATDPAQRKAYLTAAQAAGKDVQALTRQLDLIGRYIGSGNDSKGEKGGEPVFTPEEKAAAKKYGVDPDAPSLASRLTQGARGLAQAASKIGTPSDAFVSSAIQKIKATGKIDQGDAVALAIAFGDKPELKQQFDKEQLDAIKVISGRSF